MNAIVLIVCAAALQMVQNGNKFIFFLSHTQHARFLFLHCLFLFFVFKVMCKHSPEWQQAAQMVAKMTFEEKVCEPETNNGFVHIQ